MTHDELLDKVFYSVSEKLYSVMYHCIECNQDYNIKGAMPKRHYFCDDCGMELL